MPSSFDVNANVKLNSANLNASAKKIEMALGRITGQASEFQKSLDASTARVFAFGATTLILNSVNQAFKKLVSTTIEVEKKLIEINSIFQASEKVFNRFRNSIFQVAKDTGQAFDTVADGAAELARQGLSAEETAKRLKAALVLTRISGLGAEKSVKALTAAINGFASAGLSANQIVNKMVAVDTAFAVSAQDLAEAFSRAGSTAEDAGVSFNELLGLVTAVEQKTARGGAVIGNAFKSIFTRLSRGDTIESLRELGVEITSAQSGVQKLGALSAALEKISDPTIASKIKELAGGVFQINVVSAALKDLSSETSIFAGAATTAANATNEAFEKNADLNQALAAQINALVVGLTSLASRIGSITFGPLLENLVGLVSKFTGFLDAALDPEKGNKLIKGFFGAIGKFLSGPAIVVFTAAFVKIFALVAKFAKDGLVAVFAIGSEASKIKNVEAGIVGLLQKDKDLRNIILSSTTSQATKEAAIINAIRQENALLTQQAALMSSIASAARARGVASFSGASGRFKGRKGMAFAGGFQQEEAMARGLGAGNSVKAHFGQGTIGGRKFIMNNQEREIPNFNGGMDSAVIPMYPAGNPKGYGTGGSAAGASAARKRKVTRVLVDPSSYAFITPSKASAMGAANYKAGHNGSTKIGSKRVSFQLANRIQSFYPNLKDTDQIAEPYDSRLYKKMSRAATDAAVSYGGMIAVPSGNKANRDEIKGLLGQKGAKGAYGAIRASAGAAFEAAVTSAFGLQDFSKGKKYGDFDVRKLNTQGNGELAQTLGSGNKRTGDLKVGASPDTVASFIGKIIKERGGPSKFRTTTTNRARGFIPKVAKGSKLPKFAGGKVPKEGGGGSGMKGLGVLFGIQMLMDAFGGQIDEATGEVSAFSKAMGVLTTVLGGIVTVQMMGIGGALGGLFTKMKGMSASSFLPKSGVKPKFKVGARTNLLPFNQTNPSNLTKQGKLLTPSQQFARRAAFTKATQAGATRAAAGGLAAKAGAAGVLGGAGAGFVVTGLPVALHDLAKVVPNFVKSFGDANAGMAAAAEETFFYGKLLGGSRGGFQKFFDNIFGVGDKSRKKANLEDVDQIALRGVNSTMAKMMGGKGGGGAAAFRELSGNGKGVQEATERYTQLIEKALKEADGQRISAAKQEDLENQLTQQLKVELDLGKRRKKVESDMVKIRMQMNKEMRKVRRLGIGRGADRSALMSNRAALMGKLTMPTGPKSMQMNQARSSAIAGSTSSNLLLQKRALEEQFRNARDPDVRDNLATKIEAAGKEFAKSVENGSIEFKNNLVALENQLADAQKSKFNLDRKREINAVSGFGVKGNKEVEKRIKETEDKLRKLGKRSDTIKGRIESPLDKKEWQKTIMGEINTLMSGFRDDPRIIQHAADQGISVEVLVAALEKFALAETSLFDQNLGEKFRTEGFSEEYKAQLGAMKTQEGSNLNTEMEALNTQISNLTETITDNEGGFQKFMKQFDTDTAKGISANIDKMAKGLEAAAGGLIPAAKATTAIEKATSETVRLAAIASDLFIKVDENLKVMDKGLKTMKGQLEDIDRDIAN